MENEIKNANLIGFGQESMDSGKCGEMHPKNLDLEKRRLTSILEMAGFPWEKKAYRILEIGTGEGFNKEIFAHSFPDSKFYPSDLSFDILKAHRAKFGDANFTVCDGENLPFASNTFDMVVCRSFMHHLPSGLETSLLEEISRALKSGGIFMGFREPKMYGCDTWFKAKHLVRRYGDVGSIRLLFQRLAGGPEKRKLILSHEMTKEEFRLLDLREIRGAILHETPTKKYGGIEIRALEKNAARHFSRVCIIPFGFASSFLETCSILFRRSLSFRLMKMADDFDLTVLKPFKKYFPFESFSFVFQV